MVSHIKRNGVSVMKGHEPASPHPLWLSSLVRAVMVGIVRGWVCTDSGMSAAVSPLSHWLTTILSQIIIFGFNHILFSMKVSKNLLRV